MNRVCRCGAMTYRPPRYLSRRRLPIRCEDCFYTVAHCTCRVSLTVHQCPPRGSGIMPCCGNTPFERMADRMTLDPRYVTCGATS